MLFINVDRGSEIVKKLLFRFVILTAFLIISGCNDNSVNQIKADYIDIGFGQSLYGGYNKIDKETVQSLVKTYSQIEFGGQTNQQINYEKGIFHVKDRSGNYQVEPNNVIYEQAIEIYNEVKKQTILSIRDKED